ncbi:MAG: aromatic aminobenezylarsenical efflux permease ArsG family transporter [Acidobacteriota bacterium]|jgi:cytochrome c biogenesis protein CcdA|nr:aromatic aminobenezylarsenical efflux permease ArsG family transporter [Acidobacteriota bacterium]
MTTPEWWLALGGVALLGLQTSISPCPLATNIAAMSYIARSVSKSRDVLLSGLLYTLGRTVFYVLLATLILSAMLWSGETMTRFLQTKIHGYLGPALILIGMTLLGMISFNTGGVQGERMQKMVDSLGLWSAFPLGAIFAMAFCPTSAATFLATIALSSQFQSNVLFPTAFGMGTAVPVLIFAGIIALNARLLGKAFSVMSRIDWWTRAITGTVFIAIGIWFSSRYVYDLF